MKDSTDDKTLPLPEIPEPRRGRGRPRQYATVADRQKAYRERAKAAGKRVVSRLVLDVRDETRPLRSDVIDLSAIGGESRQPTADEQAGMDWWNNLTEVARAFWLEQAGGEKAGASVADAYAVWKRMSPGVK